MFRRLCERVGVEDPALQGHFQDAAWTMIRLARTARKQGLHHVGLSLLAKVPQQAMEVMDAFNKLREQVRTLRHSMAIDMVLD